MTARAFDRGHFDGRAPSLRIVSVEFTTRGLDRNCAGSTFAVSAEPLGLNRFDRTAFSAFVIAAQLKERA